MINKNFYKKLFENNFEENEIVITLFADHGQGYLVRPEEEFLCDERTKIAFMTKGGGVSGKTEELISACDYTPIICKLAGIEYNYENTDEAGKKIIEATAAEVAQQIGLMKKSG